MEEAPWLGSLAAPPGDREDEMALNAKGDAGLADPYRPSTEELAGWFVDGRGGVVHVDVTRSTLKLVAERGETPGLKVRPAEMERARALMERMARDAAMGFAMSPADVRELHELVDLSP
jgi:hypothetical protein